ncbi:MAG: LLM class flavin-dependent oxidoreductase, partial [Actinomyces sp.]
MRPALDVGLTVPAAAAASRARELAACGVDGLFTFEGPHDVFFPLVAAALAGIEIDLYTNVAIAFPRSPFHLAQQGREMQDLAGGRFALGLGTQVRAHIERRYSARWESPVTRMAELVGLLQAIWQAWETGGTVDHRGRHYRLDLLPPVFRP